MIRAALCLQLLSVSCLVPPPQDVRLDAALLTWSPGPGPGNASYSVQFLRYNSRLWEDVSSCARTKLTSCNVTAVQQGAEHGCVQLRVRAHKRGVTSDPVEACSTQASSCSVAFNLTARPGLLTVHLSRQRPLVDEYGDHALHQLYCGREGEKLHDCGVSRSSRSIPDLQPGTRYCVSVQIVLHSRLLGAAGCPQCIHIPHADDEASYTRVVAAVVPLIAVIGTMMAAAYGFLFHREKIKKCLQPPFQWPELLSQPLPEHQPHPFFYVPSDERFDGLSLVLREE